MKIHKQIHLEVQYWKTHTLAYDLETSTKMYFAYSVSVHLFL